ncbi:P-loop NTPase fold protein [Cyclobacterium sp. SYSU L10401]|uniref:KAP family P-loop NTPase fold protein n=1 Tax=Cyclobacterium sp. SYSU L10401 TaxID=2678657 RepID=UPI0013D3F2FC|nr:P-loop NTPase fold protein [Cyclobacterium sp. SYSU L10401]
MKIKHHEIEIPQEKPFANCKLAREPYARVLSDIVSTFSDGFVLAINNEWGTGKTTFVKMWQQQLRNDSFQTIYFNAWENDFDNNPLVALMSELETLTNAKNEKIFKSVVEKGAVLVKNIAPALAKSLIKKYLVDIEGITVDSIESATKASTEILEEEIKEYSSKKKTIVEFRKELENFVNQAENEKPLIFIVDELDRCRPNYAVEVLEQIKHFFSVSGIVFVLSIDKKHLASAVKGFYGSEQIDSNEYLRRFIDLEYSIPKPSTKDFIKYLFEYYSFRDFFSSQERMQFREFQNDSENFILMADFLLTKSNTTLRQQERIFALTRLVLCSFKIKEYTFPHLLFLLVYLKIMKVDLYQQIDNGELSLQELSDSIGDLMFSEEKDNNRINTVYVEALLLWFYNNTREYRKKIDLLARDEEGKLTTPIQSKLLRDNDRLASYFENIDRQRYDHIKLDFLLKRINLTETVTIQQI